MASQTEKPKEPNAAVIAMRKDLALKIEAHAPSLGENLTAIPGLALYRRTTPTECFLATINSMD